MTDRENITVPNNKLSSLALLQITAMQPAQGREFTNALWKKTHENSDSFAGNVNQTLQIPVC